MDAWELLTELVNLQNNNAPIKEIVDLAEQHKELMDSRHAEVLLLSPIGDESIKSHLEEYRRILSLSEPFRIHISLRDAFRFQLMKQIVEEYSNNNINS
jgi:hypothetical protein